MVIKQNDPECFTLLMQILKNQGVVILKCDTIYGFIGIAPETEERISAIKQRTHGKPYLQLIPDISWIKRYSDFILPERLSTLWPGPLTIIIPLKLSGSVGIRIPDDLFLQKMLNYLKKPLFSTSVNREGNEPCKKIAEIISEFEDEVELIVHSGDVTDTPSTILDITSTPYKIVRQGRVIIPPDLLTRNS